jgi:hypothetical protein
MEEIERIWPAMVSCSRSVNGGWRKKKYAVREKEGEWGAHTGWHFATFSDRRGGRRRTCQDHQQQQELGA